MMTTEEKEAFEAERVAQLDRDEAEMLERYPHQESYIKTQFAKRRAEQAVMARMRKQGLMYYGFDSREAALEALLRAEGPSNVVSLH